MSATLIYTICTDGSPFRRELLTPWMVATLVDFYINVFAIAVWVAYKEQTWITALLWIVMLVCLGSITTCAYIVVQLFHLSSNDPVQDSLLRETDRVDRKLKIRCSVVMGRILFSVLGCLMFAILVYTLITDGSPFRKEILTPWMNATLVDFYINVIALSVCLVIQFSWIKHGLILKLHVYIFSVMTCVYIVIRLCQLSPDDPPYLVLLDSQRKQVRYLFLYKSTFHYFEVILFQDSRFLKMLTSN
ncbi:hypothetical protein QJS04_geneDACA021427 [Acorus gramineus]|uniref:XK-related protein n=1 Tax=Acorus gramineus TaxID=55184 RepID=A0AAV9A6Q7_ACOGR|nr:hypothetical protein QJS04_geneDACA021427 [Acorus gramineus]